MNLKTTECEWGIMHYNWGVTFSIEKVSERKVFVHFSLGRFYMLGYVEREEEEGNG